MTKEAEPSFGSDLRLALAAWRRFPWLPAVSVGLAAIAHVPEESAFYVVLLLAWGIASAGWLGTERICYLRASRGKSIHVGELWRLTRSFVVRYSALGLLLLVAFVPLAGLAYTRVLSDDPAEFFRSECTSCGS